MTPGDLAPPPAEPAAQAVTRRRATAAGAAATRVPDRVVMRSSVLPAGPIARRALPGCSPKELLPRSAGRLLRQRQLDLEGVVDLDRLPAQQRRRVPALFQRFDHGPIH